MRSKEIFTEEDRVDFRESYYLMKKSSKCYDALMLAEAEIEELREKLHLANVEISSFTDLRPEN